MAYEKKEWKNRESEYPLRRTLRPTDGGSSMEVDVERAEGLIFEDGNAFDSENMNDMETRIEKAVSSVETATNTAQTTANTALNKANSHTHAASDIKAGALNANMSASTANMTGYVLRSSGVYTSNGATALNTNRIAYFRK